MAGLTTTQTNDLLQNQWKAQYDFTPSTGHTFKLVLVASSPTGTYDRTTSNYTDVTGNSDEQASSGTYATGGTTLTVATGYPQLSSNTMIVDFDDWSVTSATVSTDGGIVIDTDAGAGTANRVPLVQSWGGTVTTSAGTFTVQFPTPGASAGAIYADLV